MTKTYCINIVKKENFSHLTISIFGHAVEKDMVRYLHRIRAEVKWQTDKTAGEWYGMKYQCKGSSKDLARMATLCKAFDKWSAKYNYTCSPKDFQKFLDERGFLEVSWDGNHLVTKKEHGLRVYNSYLDGDIYGQLYAKNQKDAMKIAKWQHPKCNRVVCTDKVLNFNEHLIPDKI